MNHYICQPLSQNSDTVYIAASAIEYDGRIWWMIYRKVTGVEYAPPSWKGQLTGEIPQTPIGPVEMIEIARLKPSCSSGMLGTTLEQVPRFRLEFEESEERRVAIVCFYPENQPFDFAVYHVSNPLRIYDYADQTPPLG